MLDIHSLERRWFKYKIKSYLPQAAAIFILFLLVVIGDVWLSSKDARVVKSSQPIHTNKNLVLAEKPAPLPQENAMILEPSMEFVHALSEPTQAVDPLGVTENIRIVKPSSKTASPLPPLPDTKTLLLPPASLNTQASHSSNRELSINRNESIFDITELERRFKDTSSANLGLFIARYYYDHGEYSEAYNYALKTNAINSRIDESWIIFSKSLVKLGKVDQAKKTLQLYISQSGSDAAKGLLDTIERGNLK